MLLVFNFQLNLLPGLHPNCPADIVCPRYSRTGFIVPVCLSKSSPIAYSRSLKDTWLKRANLAEMSFYLTCHKTQIQRAWSETSRRSCLNINAFVVNTAEQYGNRIRHQYVDYFIEQPTCQAHTSEQDRELENIFYAESMNIISACATLFKHN